MAKVTDALQMRFIPTGVGNSRVKLVAFNPCSVHPHGRGELPCYGIAG